MCIATDEPILLVGETGTGKTSLVQYLADSMTQHLVVMVMQSFSLFVLTVAYIESFSADRE